MSDIPSTWKSIPGFKGYYATPAGEVHNTKTGHTTTGGVAGRYRKVSVYPTGADTPILEYTHILVCKAFHGMPKANQVVLHADDDPLNTSPSNLSWGTQSENISDMYDKGRRK